MAKSDVPMDKSQPNSKLSRYQTQPRLLLALWLIIMVAIAAYGAALWQSGAKIQTNILAMLPKLTESPLTQTALDRVEQRLADQVYIGLIADDKQQAINAAQAFMAQLQQQAEVFTDVRSGDASQMQDLSGFYFSHRFQLLTDKQRQLLVAPNQWQQLLMAAQQQLYSSFGYASSQLLAQDPLLLFPDNVMALAPSNNISSEQGILLTPYQQGELNKVAAIVIAKGVNSAFNPQAQQLQSQELSQAFTSLTDTTANLEILKAGALFHAKAATDTAKSEISTIGSISLVGVMILVWLGFRSIMPISLALLTLSCGFLLAAVATLALFGELHLLTLVFGTSLIGVAIDYSFHFYCEKINQQQRSASDIIGSILPTLSLALLTSGIAFIAIGFTPFPGMQQVAIFCAAGLFGAYLTLVLAYPALANHTLASSSILQPLAQRYLSWLRHFSCQTDAAKPQKSNKATIISIAALVIIAIAGLSQLTTNDDIRNLQQSPEAITAEENQLRQLLSGGTDNQFVLVSAASEQGLLTELEQADDVLAAAVNANELSHFVSLSKYLPSLQRQQQNYLLYEQLYADHLNDIIDTLGLDDSIKATLITELTNSQNMAISSEDVLALAGDDLAGLWLPAHSQDVNHSSSSVSSSNLSSSQSQWGSIILLGGINDLTALKSRVDSSHLSITVVDKVGDISQLMAQFRLITLQLLALVCVVAIGIFSLRFGIKLALLIVSVPVSAMILTLACLGLMGSPLSLFHALALILVLGIGIDYSLFFASVKPQASADGVMMAVFMSACSTLLAFGLLALSHTNAIHFFGLTLLFGIGFSFLLAPFISIMTREVAHYGK
ncbi:MMPL family transporter [Shewanella sp. 5_MG-2023]|uniref:MMPL family transporter n=1 Tax=Shewanella sp. 5_MG-2023 TaxID=3062656 RepID=UPI0026E4553C|nr:MMPL family transporter [Shewanella sp. 5_MG-2023]MDO6640286.1 MMPL family transporter [Shewanella sp. 5_MG-2023]